MKNCRNPRSAHSSLRIGAVAAIALLATLGSASAQDAVPAPMVPPVPTGPAIPGHQSSAPEVKLPPSTEPMEIDRAEMDAEISRSMEQVDARLSSLSITPGKLENADPSAYKGELEEMAAIQREIRLLELKQKQADLAVKLWDTFYDDAVEDEILRAEGESFTQPVSQPSQPEFVDGAVSDQPNMSMRRPEPQPVVVAVLGSGEDIKATILVPFAGEVSAKKGTRLPNGMRIVSISADAVVAADDSGRRITLSYGNSVPRYPQYMEPMMPTGTPLPNGGVMF